jgi:hypothetical protein
MNYLDVISLRREEKARGRLIVFSMRSFFPEHYEGGLEHDAEIELQAAVVNVIKIQKDHILETDLAATDHLP